MATSRCLTTLIVYKPLAGKFYSWTIPHKSQWGRESSLSKYHTITQSIENIYIYIPAIAGRHKDSWQKSSFYLFSINVKYSQNSRQFYLTTPRRNLQFFLFLLHAFNFAMLSLEPVATETSRKIFTKDGIKEF